MEGPDMPIAMGVIRAVPTECYDEAVHNQIKEVQEKAKCHTFDELLGTLEQWDM
jgi:2-oxoglutarate ferredoxin oxidoreductase subunit beta